jgi:hypothetical protein
VLAGWSVWDFAAWLCPTEESKPRITRITRNSEAQMLFYWFRIRVICVIRGLLGHREFP